MNLATYSKPKNDTGIGYSLAADSPFFTTRGKERWLGELKSMGASWLALSAPFEQPAPGELIRSLVREHIEPIVGLIPQVIEPLPESQLRQQAAAIASAGAHYAYIYNEPNMLANWEWYRWAQPRLVERFVGYLVPAMVALSEAGLSPLFPPLRPGGDYWDLAFLENSISALRATLPQPVFDKMGVAIQNMAFNHPAEWGQGGSRAHPKARLYCAYDESQDHQGFCLYEWYDEVIRRAGEHSLPLLAVKSGAALENQLDKNYPAVDQSAVTSLNLSLVQQMQSGNLPGYLFNLALYPLSGQENDEYAAAAWFNASGVVSPIVPALKQMRFSRRPQSLASTSKDDNAMLRLDHYLLLPSNNARIAHLYWQMAEPFVRTFNPVCGTSAEYARMARRVTVLGGKDLIPEHVVNGLAAAGCVVERIAGSTHSETGAMISSMARTVMS